MGEIAVSMKNITRMFGDFCALNKVNLDVKKGTIHALLGENGAGKSTLMNILYGLLPATSGEIHINGKPVHMKNPNVAISNGIGMVHQHFMLVENFTVTQNIMLGKETTKGFGFIDTKTVRDKIIELSKKYELSVDPDAVIEDISVGMQQRVEILKALYRGVDILILDEPTAVLTPQEINELIKIMRNLIADNKTIIIITHKLKEIQHSADYCTIIRRGVYIDTVDVAGITENDLAAKMVGREVNLHIEKGPANPGEVVFNIENLVVKDPRGIERIKNLALSVRRGEIFGLAGIDGNGQKELVEAITSLKNVETGTIKINNKEIQNTNPRTVMESGVSTIHEDRHKRGLVLSFSVAENSVIEKYRTAPFSKNGQLNFNEIFKFAKEQIKKFDIRPDNCERLPAKALSGGNQQKIILARELASNPDLLIAVQPTRGLDVGAIEYIHKCLVEQRDKGKAVLLISLELDEVMDVSDRIGVIYDGQIVAIIPQNEADENKLGLLMAGGGVAK